jgi:hypothetical protein
MYQVIIITRTGTKQFEGPFFSSAEAIKTRDAFRKQGLKAEYEEVPTRWEEYDDDQYFTTA